MKRTILPIAALLLSTVVHAEWLNTDNTDEITGKRTVSAFSYVYKQDESIGVRCDVSDNKKSIMLTFNADNAFGTPRTNVDMFVKVDDNQPISFRGQLYTNSYRAGYVNASGETEADVSKLLAQMIAGNKAYVKIQNDRRSEIVDFNVSLSGFTAKSKKALSACSFNPKAREITPEDKARLSEISSELKKLQSEKTAILSKY
ncbi:hypothetical protein CGH86_13990 [Vibrio parahaemolyticus]|uniref:hypothetical protein n=1 Tax=Vibrio parahaemolyticus TaxID=670 RepID=UPI00111D610A|nr:hypothetical protein [Vibrio parahaemolyticus]TOM02113.1 hypothetical protein CGH86_13990 [Vibrio parahaemolyticus]